MESEKYGVYKTDSVFGKSSSSIMVVVGVVMAIGLIVGVIFLFMLR